MKEDERRLKTLEMKCLKTILWFTLLDYVRNERIKQALKVEKTIIDIIHKKQVQ